MHLDTPPPQKKKMTHVDKTNMNVVQTQLSIAKP